MKTTGKFAMAAVGAILASSLALSSCVSVWEGEVKVTSAGHGRSAPQTGPAYHPQPTPRPAPPPRKAPPPRTVRQSVNVVLNAGDAFTISESNGEQDECFTSNGGVINMERQEGSRGGIRYVFRAYNGGSAVITYKRYHDGYLVLIKEYRVTVRPAPAAKGGDSAGHGRKAYQ